MTTILDKQQLQLTITRLAHQLLEDAESHEEYIIIGLQPRGVFISDRLIEALKKLTTKKISYGKLDITFYRDDFRKELHSANRTEINFSIENKKVILVDDVLYTGRTIRAAMDALLDFGRPQYIKLCVLVNRRFNRELPIQPDYCGIAIDSIVTQKVKVNAEVDEVMLYGG